MIRGPVLPQVRESLWSLVATRLDRIESGLTLVLEGLDCSGGQLGLVDGLARDAIGAPVLVLLAVDGDSLLPARALSAGQFLQRVGDALTQAVPEANFCPGVAGRVLLVGTSAAVGALEQVARLPIARLQACSLEPFRIAGSERFAVRWLAAGDAGAMPAESGRDESGRDENFGLEHPAFVAPAARADLWAQVERICERIDAAVCVSGDRYLRRISWNGLPLGDVRTVSGSLIATAATGVTRDLRDAADVQRFGDQLLRAYVQHAGLQVAAGAATEPSNPPSPSDIGSEPERSAATRHAAPGRRITPNGESLRSSLAAARLSQEEYSALGDPASVAGSIAEDSLVAEDRKQTSFPRGSSTSVGRTD